MPIKNELTGKTFGRWFVVGEAGRDAGGSVLWACRCACGTERTVFGSSLTRGLSTSCGCYSRELTSARSRKYGQIHTPLYKSWADMISRTTNPNNSEFPNYGGRGVQVCSEWRVSFEAFARDMGPTHGAGLTLERRDVDGPYSPGNCTWATRKQQSRNRRNTLRATFQGSEKPLTEWCESLGINYRTAYYRIHRHGWSVERALTTPTKEG